ncbi:hypothetical protein [Pseudoalteromonas phage PH357]|nr:hypothetical protein [Pseudoalteromonas phage PH357]
MYKIDHKIPKHLHNFRDKLVAEFENYLKDNFVNITQNKHQTIIKAVSCFTLNLNKAMVSRKKAFGVTLSSNSFSKSVIVNGRDTKRKVSYTYTKSLLNFLNLYNYIDLHVGGEVEDYTFYNNEWIPSEFSKSYVKLQERLINLYNECVTKPTTFELIDDVVKLRDADKNQKSYRVTEYVRDKISYVNRYNKFSLEVEVVYREERLDTQIYKVYNKNFKTGGRSIMNSEYQMLNGEKRDEVTIGGDNTCCYDYKGFEPSIAYSIKQELMEGDPYHFEELIEQGYETQTARKLAKAVFVICLNCDNLTQAKRAISMWISENMDLKELYSQGKIPVQTIRTGEVIDIMLDHHHMIADIFFSSHRGFCVQNIGSEINDFVCDSMIQNHKTLVIQVHDDFRCTVEKEQELKDTMFKAYEVVLGFTDNCQIVKES